VAGGLSRLRGAPIGTFGGAEGRVSTAVKQRLEDRGGRLWLSQTRGLVIRLPGQAGAVGMAPGVEPAVHHGTAPGAQRKAVGVRAQSRSAAVSRRTVQPLHRSADVLLSLPGRPLAGARGYGAGTGRRRIHALALAARGKVRQHGQPDGRPRRAGWCGDQLRRVLRGARRSLGFRARSLRDGGPEIRGRVRLLPRGGRIKTTRAGRGPSGCRIPARHRDGRRPA
jgi:hypothetical protein